MAIEITEGDAGILAAAIEAAESAGNGDDYVVDRLVAEIRVLFPSLSRQAAFAEAERFYYSQPLEIPPPR